MSRQTEQANSKRSITQITRERFIRMPVVLDISGLSKTTIYEYVSRGEFPAPVSLGAKSVAWVESEVVAWMDAKMSAREV
jgi:prophage regulatory protein